MLRIETDNMSDTVFLFDGDTCIAEINRFLEPEDFKKKRSGDYEKDHALKMRLCEELGTRFIDCYNAFEKGGAVERATLLLRETMKAADFKDGSIYTVIISIPAFDSIHGLIATLEALLTRKEG